MIGNTPGSTALFSFPGISLAPPSATPNEASPGVLKLSAEAVPTAGSDTDYFLRLEFAPDSTARGHPVDVLISARETLSKIAAAQYTLTTEFGVLYITFPTPLHAQIPVDDDRIDLPREVRADLSWEDIARAFENEVDRWVVYRKNQYSLTDGVGGITGPSDKTAYSNGNGAVPNEKGGYANLGYYDEAAMTGEGIAPYDPRDMSSGTGGQGKLVLVDEENGNEVGEVGGMSVHTEGIKPGSKDPVEITMPASEGGAVMVRPAGPAYLADALDPVYRNSKIVSTAASASRLIVTTSSYIAEAMNKGATTFTTRTAPVEKPLTFQPSTHERFAQLHTLSSSAAKLSSATLGRVGEIAQNAGARLVGKNDERQKKGAPANPGLLNKSLIAFGTIADGIDFAGRSLLGAGAGAASTVVGHRYGPDARRATEKLAGSVRNVGLVYIDGAGVSRRAVVKGMAKGMVIGRVRGGGDVVIPADPDMAAAAAADEKKLLDGAYAQSPSPYASPAQTPLQHPTMMGAAPGPSSAAAATPPAYSDGGMYFPPPPKQASPPAYRY